MLKDGQSLLALHIPDREVILERLERVLDPELDQSVLELGFIESIEAENGHLTVETQLPTSWCSPNFAYMMAEDIRRELLSVDSVQEVTVRVRDNVVSAAIEAGVNSGQTFSEAFAGEAFENLGELRGLFLRKGYIKRQEALLRRLRDAGVSFEAICALQVKDVSYEAGACLLPGREGQVIHIEPDTIVRDYLDRRVEIELDFRPDAALFVDLRGEPVTAEQLEKYLVYARTVRLSLEANGSLCSALLEAKKAQKQSISLI
jgi:metal-sulfur cluster biosynthetic enzyme